MFGIIINPLCTTIHIHINYSPYKIRIPKTKSFLWWCSTMKVINSNINLKNDKIAVYTATMDTQTFLYDYVIYVLESINIDKRFNFW